jgi:hypothetical protein
MYSMVLMMALASGPDTASFGGRNGCHGASACCSAQVSYGCHGSSCMGSGCMGSGCHGSSCHGGGLFRGGLFHRNRGGCCGGSMAARCCTPAPACCAPVATCCAPVNPCCGGAVMVTPAAAPPATMPNPMGEKKGS